MKAVIGLVAILSLVSCAQSDGDLNATGLSKADKPVRARTLRDIAVGSELSLRSDLYVGRTFYFQNGKSVIQFDLKLPYCNLQSHGVQEFDGLRNVTTIHSIEGDYWGNETITDKIVGQFRTKITVVHNSFTGEISCYKPVVENEYGEMTIAEFEQVMGDQINLGKVTMERGQPVSDFPGLDLTPRKLRQDLFLQLGADLPEGETKYDDIMQYTVYKLTIQGGKIVSRDSLDYEKPYCLFSQIAAKNELKKGTQLHFKSVDAGYQSDSYSKPHSYFVSTLEGKDLQGTIRLYCSSPGLYPIDYQDALDTTTGLIGWVHGI